MKSIKLLLLFFCLQSNIISAQFSLYRSYVPQNPLPFNYTSYVGVDIHTPVQTADKGYILGYHPWCPNIHWAYPEDFYVIKTDSNLVPQWKYPYFCRSVALPTGGILLYWNAGFFGLNGYQKSFIQKVTASGATVWTKEISGDTEISDGVAYGNKVRFIGSKIDFVSYLPVPTGIYNGFSMELDTNGTVTGSSIFNLGDNNYFERITRTPTGDFIVSTQGKMRLLKFNSSFNITWAKAIPQGATNFYLQKIIALTNGDFLATGLGAFDPNSNFGTIASVFRISAAGQIQAVKYIPGRYSISDLCRNAQGNFVGTFKGLPNDSLQIFEMDSILNILSVKLLKKGKAIGGPARTSSGLVIPFFDNDPKVITSNQSGGTCYTLPGLGPFVTTTAALAAANATAMPLNFTFTNTSPYNIAQQNYSDTCKCNNPVITSGSQVCSGSTASVQANTFGGVNWFAAANGGTPISSGNTYYFVATTGPQQIVYAAAASCGLSRTPATVSVLASPQIQVVSDKTIMCLGEVATVSVIASSTVAWAPSYSTVTIYTTSATGTGSLNYSAVAPNGCSGMGSVKILGDQCTGLPQTSLTELQIYPNPTKNSLYIKFESDAVENYRLHATDGRLVKSGLLSDGATIDITELPAGLYFLKIERGSTYKIIKE